MWRFGLNIPEGEAAFRVRKNPEVKRLAGYLRRPESAAAESPVAECDSERRVLRKALRKAKLDEDKV